MTKRQPVKATQLPSTEPVPQEEPLKVEEASEQHAGERRRKLSYEATLLREEAAVYLQSIVDSLRSGTLTLCHEAGDLKLSIAPALAMELKAAQKGDNERISVELCWSRSDALRLRASAT